jgi:hexosaminidase
MRKSVLLPLILSVFGLSFTPKQEAQKLHIIPQPESVEIKKGHFTLSSDTKIFIPGEFLKDFEPYVKEKMMNDAGLNVAVSEWEPSTSKNFIRFEKTDDPAIEDEGYLLEISANQIIAKASSYTGIFNAFQTIRQIIPANARQFPDKSISIQNLLVRDKPRFEWRGLMLDHSRHFQPKEFIIKQIDIISSYKINKFHWHLTDDQGWRIEIKKYPNLTQKGAWRADRTGIHWWSREFAKPDEPKPIGGYYSQEEIREIVEYARIRNVEIIPEIDLPGHSKALKAAYPHLSCRQDLLFEVSTGGRSPNNTICAGRETTYEFIDGVIGEIAALFPSKYIHIGGDECNKSDWTVCPECNKKLKENHLENFDELQSYFITRINSQVTHRGKTMIGWDEILSGKGTPGAIIMAWRRNRYSPEVDAPRAGYQTIQASYTDSYINNHQGPAYLEPEAPRGIIPLKKVYDYEPVPKVLTEQEAGRIMGTQVCLWGEFTPNPEICELMLYPRVLANAEVGWTKPALKNWKRFEYAVEENFVRLDRDHVNYSKSTYNPMITFVTDTIKNTAKVDIQPDSDIHHLFYTINGTDPTTKSKKYDGPFTSDLNSVVKTAVFNRKGELLGKVVAQRLEVVKKVK